MDTSFRDVLSQLSQADSVRPLPWFLSASARSSVGPTHVVSETLTTIMQPRADAFMDTTPEPEGTTALVPPSSPACRVSTPPLALHIPDILATGTPVWQPFIALTLGLKHKKLDQSPCSTPENHSGKRADAGTKEGSISSGHSTPPIQLMASCSPKYLDPGLIDLPSSPVKAITTSNERLATEVSGKVRG